MKTVAFLAAFLLSAAPSVSGANTPPMSEAMAEMHSSMKSMCENMDKMPMSTDINEAFLQMMIPHHQAAVDMANAYLKEGSDPRIIELAKHIIEAQKKEIEEMKIWLKEKDTGASAF